MSAGTQQRKLAAIMFTDMVRYSGMRRAALCPTRANQTPAKQDCFLFAIITATRILGSSVIRDRIQKLSPADVN